MANKKYVCGYEIGGTNVTIALGNTIDGFLEKTITSEPVNYREGDDGFTKQVLKLRDEAIGKAGITIDDILFNGIAAAGQPNPNKSISNAANCTFVQTFPQKLDEVLIRNDVAGAAYGSMMFGLGNTQFKEQGSPRWDCAMTIGTGLNYQMLMDGELVRNAKGQTGEGGHIAIHDRFSGRLCGCNSRGCAEAYISGAGIANIASIYLLELFNQKYKGDGNKAIQEEGILQATQTRIEEKTKDDVGLFVTYNTIKKEGKDILAAFLLTNVTPADVFEAYKNYLNQGRKDNTSKQIVTTLIKDMATYFGNVLQTLPPIPYIEVYGGIVENNPWVVPSAVRLLNNTPELWGNRDLKKDPTEILLTKIDRLGLRGTVGMGLYELGKQSI